MKSFIHSCLLFLLSFPVISAWSQTVPPSNWYLLDQKADGCPGISLEKAYNSLLKNKAPKKKIIVAVIDDAVDFTHPDLKGLAWVNKKETAGNGKDDDANGFIDDIHGWNFVGNQQFDVSEPLREYVRLRQQFEGRKDTAALQKNGAWAYWQKVVAEKNNALDKSLARYNLIKKDSEEFSKVNNYWRAQWGNDSVNCFTLKGVPATSIKDSNMLASYNYVMEFYRSVTEPRQQLTLTKYLPIINARLRELEKGKQELDDYIQKGDPAFFRKQRGDDPYQPGTAYGISDLTPVVPHGTGCAGVIGALRKNGNEADGITNAVEFISIRIGTSEGDEWDKDVAAAIRYAANSGARVVNMSFSKYLSPEETWVQEAMQYAAKKGILLIRGAGNDRSNNDERPAYPEHMVKNETTDNLIVVGASTYDLTLVAPFSNYGKRSVDVFAPGVRLQTTALKGGYQSFTGTSAATPVVTGLAALILSYYPGFTYTQVRRCIEGSVDKTDTLVTKPGTNVKVPFSKLSRTGGVVNAYRALQLAASLNR